MLWSLCTPSSEEPKQRAFGCVRSQVNTSWCSWPWGQSATSAWKLSTKKKGDFSSFFRASYSSHIIARSYLASSSSSSSSSSQWTRENTGELPFLSPDTSKRIHAKFNMPTLPPARRRLTDLSSLHQSEGVSPWERWAVGGGETGGADRWLRGTVKPSDRNFFLCSHARLTGSFGEVGRRLQACFFYVNGKFFLTATATTVLLNLLSQETLVPTLSLVCDTWTLNVHVRSSHLPDHNKSGI